MASTSPVAALYFIALMTFGNYVLFNLLVAILVEGFQTEVGQSSNDHCLPPTFTFCSPFVFLFCSPPSLPLPVFLILSIPLLLIIFQVCLFPLSYSLSFCSFLLCSPFSLMIFIFFNRHWWVPLCIFTVGALISCQLHALAHLRALCLAFLPLFSPLFFFPLVLCKHLSPNT